MQRKSNGKTLLSPQKEENMLRANERNLAVKVKAGKTLSVAELNLLQTIESGVRPEGLTYARNQQDLAVALGINRKTITRYARRPGAPIRRADGRYDVAAWRS